MSMLFQIRQYLKIDMCKKHYFHLQKIQALLIIWRQSLIKVNFHQSDGESILGYSCQNKKGLVDVIYFGSNDIILDKPELRDDESYALDVVNTQLCKQNAILFKRGDFSLQSLLLTMKRVTNKDFKSSPDVIEYHPWARLVLLQFIIKVLGIVTPGPSEWLYDYADKGLKRDDVFVDRDFL